MKAKKINFIRTVMLGHIGRHDKKYYILKHGQIYEVAKDEPSNIIKHEGVMSSFIKRNFGDKSSSYTRGHAI